MKSRTVKVPVQITLKAEFLLKIVKVKSYVRTRNGKKEKVRTHYRRY